MNLSEVLRGLKRGLIIFGTPPSVDMHARALQVVRGLFWCLSTNF